MKGPSDSCVKPESYREALVESIEAVEREGNESDKALNNSVPITGENSKGKIKKSSFLSGGSNLMYISWFPQNKKKCFAQNTWIISLQ
jgi:uncharacterized glyoxalase superfamily protein PhnB